MGRANLRMRKQQTGKAKESLTTKQNPQNITDVCYTFNYLIRTEARHLSYKAH